MATRPRPAPVAAEPEPEPEPEPVSPAPRRFAPDGVALADAWDAILVLSIANLLVAVAVGLVFAGVGYANVMRQPARYQSSAVMLLDQPIAIARGDSGVIVKLNLLRAKYVALINTSEIAVPAAREAGLPVAEVARAQRPLFAPNTLTISPIARADTAQKAQRIAQATAETLSRYVADEQAATGLPPNERLTLRIVQNARAGAKASPVARRGRQVAAVAFVAGVLITYVGLQLRTARQKPTTS